ncbi:MAG: 50S ribosomal protein L10 [Candidatus Kuenenia sp.]|nr:50S ribosomal protein L10 [Candidatus Kuenenia hertensis]
MPNELKELILKEMVSRYNDTSSCLVVGYRGVTALQFNQLRNELWQKKIFMEVVKNSLAAIAFKETGRTEVIGLLDGPSAIITGGDDPVVMAKEAVKLSEEMPFLALRGGIVDGELLSIDSIKNLAKLPSLPVLRTQIVTSINAPVVGVASAFNSILRSLATVFQEVKTQKEKSNG